MSGECEKCGYHTLECECETKAPERIGRYEYSPINIQYAEPPAFISGATEYVRADLFDTMKAERDEAKDEAFHATEAFNTASEEIEYWKAYAKKADADRDDLLAFIKPFADEAPKWADFRPDEKLVEGWNEGPDSELTVNDLRHAREVSERIGGRDV